MARPIPELLVHADVVPEFLDLISMRSGLTTRALCVELCTSIGAGDPRAFERNWYRWMGFKAAPTLPSPTIICALERVARKNNWIDENMSPAILRLLVCAHDLVGIRGESWDAQARKRMSREVKQLVSDRLDDHVPIQEIIAPLVEIFLHTLVEVMQNSSATPMESDETHLRDAVEDRQKRSALVIAKCLAALSPVAAKNQT